MDEPICQVSIGYLKKKFDEADKDGDDQLNLEEFAIMAKSVILCESGGCIDADKLFRQADRQGKGAVDFLEFVGFFHSRALSGCTLKPPPSQDQNDQGLD